MSGGFEAVGQAIGASCALAVVVFVVARKACGPGGSRHLARLKRLAGEEVNESALSLYVRDWLPAMAALSTALLGGLFVVAAAGGSEPRALTARDLPQLVAGFAKGCERNCGAQIDSGACQSLCACVLANLRLRHVDDDDFAAWMQSGQQNPLAVQTEVASATQQCVADRSALPGASVPSTAAN